MFKGPTAQFQCDEGSAPTTGFSVNSQGQLEYQGKTDFVACETGMNGGLNLYIEESDNVTGCKDIKLSADKCSGSGAGSSPSGSGSSSASVPAGSSAPSSPAPRPSSSTPAVSSVQVSSSAQASSPSGWAPGAGGSTPAVSTSAVSTPAVSTSSVQVSSSAQASSPSGWAPAPSPSGWAPAPGSSQVPSVPGVSSVPAASSSMSQVTVWTTKTNYECNSESTPFPGVPSGTPSGPQSQTVPVSWAPSSSGGSQPSGYPSYPSSSQPGGGSQPSGYPSSSQPGGGAQPSGTSSASQPSGTPPSSGSGKTCPTNLNGEYTAPHLIIPVDSSSPDTAPGTSYNGTISSTLTTLYKFDVPQSYADKTCSLVFLFPKQEDLETSAFTFSGDGKIDFASLESPVSEETSYSNIPGVKEDYGVTTVSPDNHYVISTFQCPAGEAVSYEMKNAGSTYLDFFEDYNPSP